MPAETGLALIAKAMEKGREERIFQQWVVQLPVMAYSGKHISFADYKDKVTGANIDRRSTAEILAELDDLERELQEGGTA
jgi:hypothetical protein